MLILVVASSRRLEPNWFQEFSFYLFRFTLILLDLLSGGKRPWILEVMCISLSLFAVNWGKARQNGPKFSFLFFFRKFIVFFAWKKNLLYLLIFIESSHLLKFLFRKSFSIIWSFLKIVENDSVPPFPMHVLSWVAIYFLSLDDPFSTYAKFSEELTLVSRIFWKIRRTYWMMILFTITDNYFPTYFFRL